MLKPIGLLPRRVIIMLGRRFQEIETLNGQIPMETLYAKGNHRERGFCYYYCSKTFKLL